MFSAMDEFCGRIDHRLASPWRWFSTWSFSAAPVSWRRGTHIKSDTAKCNNPQDDVIYQLLVEQLSTTLNTEKENK
jgi:hypothetical protein